MDVLSSENNIQHLLEIGVVDSREDAIARLNANGNDVARTINAIFDNPSGTGTAQAINYDTWNETHFHQARDEQEGQNAATANNSESLQPNVFGAPSRPPSRVNDRGSVINLAEEHARADPSMSLSVEDRNQQDMQKALELSMKPQESGVVSNTQFGPATQEHYETNKWALTTTQSSTHEIILDPDPADRKRQKAAPAMLKPSPNGPFLAALLTILHSIPLGREALLLPNHLLADYGFDKEWWSGTPLRVSRVIETREQMENVGRDDVIHETQRLMAFLDLSTRSYASVDALANLPLVQEQNVDSVPNSFLEAWADAIQKRTTVEGVAGIFRSNGVRRYLSSNEEAGCQEFSILELTAIPNSDGFNMTLYEAMDSLIWDETFTEHDFYATLEAIGDVFTVMVSHATPGKGLKIPSVWYPDRYLAESRELAAELREKLTAGYKDIEKKEKMAAQLRSFKPLGHHTSLDPRTMLDKVVTYLEGPSGEETQAGSRNTQQTSENDRLVRHLRTLAVNVTNKLQSLEAEIAEAKKDLRDVSSHFLTEPSEDPKYNPTHRYHLRGLTTDANTTYILRDIQEGEQGNTLDALSRGDQWWKLRYSTADPNPVTMTTPTNSLKPEVIFPNDPPSMNTDKVTPLLQKVSEVQVLKAARDEGRSTLLIYASDNAVDKKLHNSKTPTVLKEFVEKDNDSFATELQGSTSPPVPTSSHPATARSTTMSASPPKRKASPDASPPRWGGESPAQYHEIIDDSPTPPLSQEKAPPLPKRHSASEQGKTRDTAVNLLDDDDDDNAGQSQEMEERHSKSGGLLAAGALGRSGGRDGGRDSEMRDADLDEQELK
ncbi:MAG: hypothetical protein M4579_001826 [Chaenotheca gracillima]|nr:MAG: hypothetical protein M4579_001826 [Chaenotheca gracillima]